MKIIFLNPEKLEQAKEIFSTELAKILTEQERREKKGETK